MGLSEICYQIFFLQKEKRKEAKDDKKCKLDDDDDERELSFLVHFRMVEFQNS